MVAGCAPGVRTMTRSVLFHCTTWFTGFVAWAIAGTRFPAASNATTVVPASNRVFISVLRDVGRGREFEPVNPAAILRRSRVIAVRRRAASRPPPRPEGPPSGIFYSMARKGMNICDESCVARCDGARVRKLRPRSRLDRLPAHENFTRSTTRDDSPELSLTALRQRH